LIKANCIERAGRKANIPNLAIAKMVDGLPNDRSYIVSIVLRMDIIMLGDLFFNLKE